MDRERWSYVVDPLIETLRSFTFNGAKIDVRENVAFFGKGEQTRFVHDRFPNTGCAIAVEFKKIFMDEWTGKPDSEAIRELRGMLAATVPLLENILLGTDEAATRCSDPVGHCRDQARPLRACFSGQADPSRTPRRGSASH